MDILRTQGQKSKNISHQPIPKGSTLSIISENLHSSSLDHQSAESVFFQLVLWLCITLARLLSILLEKNLLKPRSTR
ncbi:uncharacterized protein LOC105845207 isoform X3 [Hydra vulgaris]|uniref:Uncharacterized protein LOC105845207 isoform X3 n=1 Tax=Hydra vulgaris TaxID=6087 RepID=A0ABM4BHJ8_HYDVU